jgi:hypothetical protein
LPVSVKEHVRLTALDSTEHEGVGIANNLAAIETASGETVYGVVTGLVKVRTTIVCDNPLCCNSSVTDDFRTVPALIEFDDNGDNSAEFIKKLSEVVITSDYKGEKKAFCTQECAAKYLRREPHVSNVVTGPFGKGPREVK